MSSGFSPFNVKEHAIREEIMLLWTHWKCFTSDTQTLLIYLLRKLLKDNEGKFHKETLSLVDELTTGRAEQQEITKEERSKEDVFVFFKILKLQNLRHYYLHNLHNFDDVIKKARQDSISKRTRSFEPLNALLPSLKHYYLMSRCYGDRIPYEEEPQQSRFYQPPRLFKRGEELWEAQGRSFTSTNKGVLLLTVQGTHIAAGRGLALSNGNTIEWWMKKSHEYRGLIGQQEIMVQEGKENEVVQVKINTARPDNSPTELQLQHKFIGHQGMVTALDLSDDELFLISAATDKIIKLWCLRTKMVLLHFKNHTNIIWSLKFSSSGYFFLSSSADHTMKLWRTDTPVPIRVFSGHQSDVYKAEFMKNPDYVISCSADKTLKIWAIETAENIRTINFDKEVISFTLSFSGRYVVTCEINGAMTIFDFIKAQQINTFNLFYLKKRGELADKQRYPIHDMTFSPDEEKFACISKKEIVIYSLQALKEKVNTDIYEEIRGEKNNSKPKEYSVKPKQVLNLGTEMNLLYCKYHTKDYLVVAGKR